MKRVKRTIAEGTNLFEDPPINPQESSSNNLLQSHHNNPNQNGNFSSISTSNQSSNMNTSLGQANVESNQIGDSSQPVDEKKKRLEMLRQKYLKKDKKNVKEEQPQISMVKDQKHEEKKTIQRNGNTEKNGLLVNVEKKKEKPYDVKQVIEKKEQSILQKAAIVQQPATLAEKYQPQKVSKSKLSQQQTEQRYEEIISSQEKIERKNPPPPPRRGPAVPPPPNRKPASRVVKPPIPIQNATFEQSKKDETIQSEKQSQQPQSQNIINQDAVSSENFQIKKPAVIVQSDIKPSPPKAPPVKKPFGGKKSPMQPKSVEGHQIAQKSNDLISENVSKGESEDNNLQANLSQQIQTWLKSKAKESKYENQQEEKIEKELLKKLNEVLGDQHELMGRFLISFVIKNEETFKSHQIKFMLSALTKLQQNYHQGDASIIEANDAMLLIAAKCGSEVLKHYPIPPSSSWAQRLKRISRYSSLMCSIEKQNLINFIIEQDSDLNSELIAAVIAFMPNYSNFAAFSAKMCLDSPTKNIKIMKSLKNNLNEKNIGFYFKLLHTIFPLVNDSEMMEQITKHIQSININGSYQLKKDALLKAIHHMPDEKQKSNGFDSKIEKTKSSDDDKGINLMGYVNQAIKKIKSQVPEKKNQQEEGPKDSIVWDEELKRYVINGVVPDDDSAPIVSEQTKKAPPPPPPRITKKNSQTIVKPESKPPKKRIQVVQPISGFEADANETEVYEVQKVEEEQKFRQSTKIQEVQKKVLPPPPPPRMANKKPKIQARYT